MLATPVVLEDRDFNLVVFAAHADEVDPVRQRTIFQRRSSAEVQDWFESFGIGSSARPVRTPADPARGIVARACLPARWNGVTYGYLWALDEHHRLDDALLERMMPQAARAGTLMAQRARIRQSLDGQVRDLLIGDRDVAEAAAEEIDALGALGRDAPVVAVVLDLDVPGDPPPLNLWRLPRAVVAVATGTDVVLLVPATLAARDVARDARLLFTERLDARAARRRGRGRRGRPPGPRADQRQPARGPDRRPGRPRRVRGSGRWPRGPTSASTGCSPAGRAGRCARAWSTRPSSRCSPAPTWPRRRPPTSTTPATCSAPPPSWPCTARPSTTGCGASRS